MVRGGGGLAPQKNIGNMAVDFSDYFWGEKNDGFNVLYQNMKGGISAAKDLCEFLRERAKLEEENGKAQAKLAKQLTSSASGMTCGSFTPMLLAFKVSSEKLSGIHSQWSMKLNELVREVAKYTDEQHKKHKQVKEDESPTLEAVKSIQDTTVLLHKAKELYKQRCLEVEKLKRDNASTKDLEKAEAKFRKAQDDYKGLVDKYCLIRDEFERKMTLAAKHFQEVESNHLKQMREYVETYCQIVDNNNNMLGRVYQEFQIQLTDLTVDNLLEQFTLAKHTGLEKPGPVEFDEEKISLASLTGPASDVSGGSEGKPASLSGASGVILNVTQPSTSTASNASAAASSSSGIHPNAGLAGSSAGATNSSSGERVNSNLEANKVASSLELHKDNKDKDDGVDETKLGVTNNAGDNVSTTSEPPTDSPARSPHARAWTVPGFLRRNKRKEKKKKSSAGKEEDGSESVKDMGSDGEENRKSETPTPEVDEEGYSKPPRQSTSNQDPWADFNQSKSFYSSSDDSDDETTRRKIKVEIKPVTSNGGGKSVASVDELRSVVTGLELPPPPISLSKARPKSVLSDRILSGTQTLKLKPKETRQALDLEGNSIRRSHSQSQLNKPSQDLLGLSLHAMDPVDKGEQESPSKNQTESKPISNANNSSSGGNVMDLTATLLSRNPMADLSGNLNKSTAADVSVASNTSKEVEDILGEFAGAAPKLPPKQTSTPSNPSTTSSSTLNRPSSTQREKISNSLIALPRPPSRLGPVTRQKTSPSPSLGESGSSTGTLRKLSHQISRQDSSGSPTRKHSDGHYDISKTPTMGFSRGPSPLTLGMSDSVPLAVAFQEVCHACFNGSEEDQCQVRLIGDMMISFPAGVVQMMANNPKLAQLSFKIKNASVFESVVPNGDLITLCEEKSNSEGRVFLFKMDALKDLLRVQSEMNPNAAYFNIDLLKYQVKAKPGAGSCPLQLVSYWKCSDTHTDIRLDYKYNAHAMASPCALLNMSIAVPVEGGVVNMQSQPTGTWMKESGRALWKFTELSPHSEGAGVGSLRGRFQLSDGPGNIATIAAQFNCEGTTLSGVEFELITPGYRLSLTKKRFVSGKYTCNSQPPTGGNRYDIPPGTSERKTEMSLTPHGPSEC